MPLTPYRDHPLDLAALTEAAGAVLHAIGARATDGRVTPAPDARTIRYYQSLGLLDRPLRHDGRQAIYGYRHLLQAVVVKLLQAHGQGLAEIQQGLSGVTTDALEAAVTDALGGSGGPTQTPPRPAPVSLRCVELRPGVLLTVDPRLAPDVAARLDALVPSLIALFPT